MEKPDDKYLVDLSIVAQKEKNLMNGIHKIIKTLWNITPDKILFYVNNQFKYNIKVAMNDYNGKVYNKDKITIDQIYHHLDIINNNSMFNMNEVHDGDTDTITQLLIAHNKIINKIQS